MTERGTLLREEQQPPESLPPGQAAGRRASAGGQGSEDATREIDALRASFLRAVAHDLKNPLSIITGMGATLADRQAELPAEVRVELAEAIARQGGRVLWTLENLLELDRLALGRTTVRRRWTDVAELVEGVVTALREDPAVVRTDLVEVRARVDQVLIERVVENLVRNAIEHQTSDDPIDVQLLYCGPGDDHFQIRVLDRGPGIPPEERAQIFRPYFRGDRRGVGLSLVRAFTRMHGGEVAVGDRPGGGSVFCARIPVDEQVAG